MKIRKRAVFSLMLISCSYGWANKSDTDEAWKKYITLTVGPTWSNYRETQSITLTSNLSQLYVPQTHTETLTSGAITLGLEHPIYSYLSGQLGINFGGSTSLSQNGEIWQDNDPEFNNFKYNYTLNHMQIAVVGKLLTNYFAFINPYVGITLGVGFNHAYNYSDTPLLVEVAEEPFFQSQTLSTFTYAIDAGFQKALNDHWYLGVGYEFADWGKSQLGQAAGQTTGAGISLNHLYLNELLFSLTFKA